MASGQHHEGNAAVQQAAAGSHATALPSIITHRDANEREHMAIDIPHQDLNGRLHPEELTADEAGVKHVHHADVRDLLLFAAKLKFGNYGSSMRSLSQAEEDNYDDNETAPIEGQLGWSFNDPTPRLTGAVYRKLGEIFLNGFRLLDSAGKAIRHRPELPLTIATNAEAWRMREWRDFNDLTAWDDIIARMPEHPHSATGSTTSMVQRPISQGPLS